MQLNNKRLFEDDFDDDEIKIAKKSLSTTIKNSIEYDKYLASIQQDITKIWNLKYHEKKMPKFLLHTREKGDDMLFDDTITELWLGKSGYNNIYINCISPLIQKYGFMSIFNDIYTKYGIPTNYIGNITNYILRTIDDNLSEFAQKNFLYYGISFLKEDEQNKVNTSVINDIINTPKYKKIVDVLINLAKNISNKQPFYSENISYNYIYVSKDYGLIFVGIQLYYVIAVTGLVGYYSEEGYKDYKKDDYRNINVVEQYLKSINLSIELNENVGKMINWLNHDTFLITTQHDDGEFNNYINSKVLKRIKNCKKLIQLSNDDIEDTLPIIRKTTPIDAYKSKDGKLLISIYITSYKMSDDRYSRLDEIVRYGMFTKNNYEDAYILIELLS